MAGYRETFGSNLDYARQRGVNDIGSRLASGMASLNGGALQQIIQQSRAAKTQIRDLNAEMARLAGQQSMAQTKAAWDGFQAKIDATARSLSQAKKEMERIPFGALERGIGKVATGLIGLNKSILMIGFDFLIDSIKRVYELQERWTKAIGGFNMRIGGMTAGLRGAQRAATQWSGVIRGLTDGDINEGIQMFADFTDAIGRTVEAGDQFERFGLQLARGFNLSGQGAGQLTRVLQNIGDTGDDAAKTIRSLVAGANAASIPTNLLAKDILEGSTYLARFGKEGQKTFVQGAAWARKYSITINQLKSAVEGLDMFDEAARTAARLNTAFGTMINSMDLMLTDDPAQRLEMIRQQFLAQGTTFDRLTPKQRRYLSETLKLTEDQTAALLSSAHANESYAEFQAKAAAREKRELDAKRLMEHQLRATAQTMYAFGAAFDRITVAIANAIKPLLQVFGLASDGNKKFKSFGQVMESITVTVEQFFNSLARNEKWNLFMVELANDLGRLGSFLKDFVVSGRAADLMGDIADGMKTFYVYVRDLVLKLAPAMRPLMDAFLFLSKHLDKIVAAWLVLKGANFMAGFGGGMGKAGATMGNMGLGAGVGLGAGALLGGGGAMAGGAVGGALGGIGGPIWGAVGGAVGAAVGKFVEYGIDYFFPKKKSAVELAQEDFAKEQDRLSRATKLMTDKMSLMTARQAAADQRRMQADEQLQELQRTKAGLDRVDLGLLEERVTRLAEFRKNDKALQEALVDLMNGVKPSAAGMAAIASASADYNLKLDSLRKATADMAELQKNSFELQMAERALKQAELQAQAKTLEAAKLKDSVEGKLQAAQEALGFEDVNREDILNRKGVFNRGINETIEKQRQQFIGIHKEWTEKVSKAELEQISAQKKLEQAKFDLAQKQFYIFTRQQLLSGEGGGSFLQFMEENKASGRSRAVLEQEYLRGKLATDTSFDAATRSGILGLSKFAEGGIVTRPTMGIVGEAGPEAVIPLRRVNHAQTTTTRAGQTTVVTSIADVMLDSQKVGRALVRTAITGRA